MDDHNAALQILCRVCGQRCVKWLNSRKIPNGRPKTNYKIQLIDKFGIDVTADDPRVHPAFFCLTCVLTLSEYIYFVFMTNIESSVSYKQYSMSCAQHLYG